MKPSMSQKTKSYLVFIVVFCTHLHLVAPGVYWGESSLLTTRAWFLGGSHPPGYSGFVQVLHLFQRLIPLSDIAGRSNVFGIIILAIAMVLLQKILTSLNIPDKISVFSAIGFSFVSSVVRAVSAVEVYSANLLFILLVLYILISVKHHRIRLNLSAFICGFAVIHHPTFVLLIPGLLLWQFRDRRTRVQFINQFPFVMTFFLLSMSSILYFVVRESTAPVMTWGDPDSIAGLFRLISASEESSGSFLSGVSDPTAVLQRLSDVIHLLNKSITFPGLILCIPGFYYLNQKQKGFLSALIACFVLMTLSVSLYDSNESSSFYLPGILCCWLLATAGLHYFSQRLILSEQAVTRWVGTSVGFLPILLIFTLVPNAWSQGTQNSHTINPIISARLHHQPSDYIYISRHSDVCFQNWYSQQIEHRHSGTVVFQHLLSFRWYYEDLLTQNRFDVSLGEYEFEDSREWNSIMTAMLIRMNRSTPITIADPEVFQDLALVKQPVSIEGCTAAGASIHWKANSYEDLSFGVGTLLADNITTQQKIADCHRQAKIFRLCNDEQSYHSVMRIADDLWRSGRLRDWW